MLQSENLCHLLWQPVWYAKMVVHCQILQVTVSRSTKSVITQKYEEKVHTFLTKADIFTTIIAKVFSLQSFLLCAW